MSGRCVVGCGTGRCGTVSLARWLGHQPRCAATHELRILPWNPGFVQYDELVTEMRARPADLAVDVAFYWLPYCDRLLRDCAHAQVVCLQRDRAETVASYLDKAAGRHHWAFAAERQRAQAPPDARWDGAYPHYAEVDAEAAIGYYWDDYYAQARLLERCWRGRFRIFPMEVLNSADGQREVLTYLGRPRESWVLEPGIRENRGGRRHRAG